MTNSKHKTIEIWESLIELGIFYLPLRWNGGNLDIIPEINNTYKVYNEAIL